jgi:hypothetical protein
MPFGGVAIVVFVRMTLAPSVAFLYLSLDVVVVEFGFSFCFLCHVFILFYVLDGKSSVSTMSVGDVLGDLSHSRGAACGNKFLLSRGDENKGRFYSFKESRAW